MLATLTLVTVADMVGDVRKAVAILDMSLLMGDPLFHDAQNALIDCLTEESHTTSAPMVQGQPAKRRKLEPLASPAVMLQPEHPILALNNLPTLTTFERDYMQT